MPAPPLNLSLALQRILDTEEFLQYTRPTLWEWLITQLKRLPYSQEAADLLLAWTTRLVQALGESVEGWSPTWWATLWTAGIALFVILVWLVIKRVVSTVSKEETGNPRGPVPSSIQPAGVWRQAADHAAQAGQFREAIHCLYQAVLATLAEQEAVKPREGATPREVVETLSPAHPWRQPFVEFTALFEKTWYGLYPCHTSEYDQAIRLALPLWPTPL